MYPRSLSTIQHGTPIMASWRSRLSMCDCDCLRAARSSSASSTWKSSSVWPTLCHRHGTLVQLTELVKTEANHRQFHQRQCLVVQRVNLHYTRWILGNAATISIITNNSLFIYCYNVICVYLIRFQSSIYESCLRVESCRMSSERCHISKLSCCRWPSSHYIHVSWAQRPSYWC